MIGDVLCEIKMNRRSKSKIVHVDKLKLTRNPFDMDWVFKLPRKKRELVPDIDFGGLSDLFDNLGVGNNVDQRPPAVEMER